MTDIDIRIDGHAGRITLNRPKALNALTYDMIARLEAAIDDWRNDDQIALILIDAIGDKAFCAGGDIADMYRTGKAGDFAYGQKFWRDEYRMNAKLARYPKPVVSFLQGFTMGGGVGVGCHASHRIVTDTSKIAMPECGIGLVPDVGGSLILARAPGALGTYIGLTTNRLTGADAIHAGFADHLIEAPKWDTLKTQLSVTGDTTMIAAAATPTGKATPHPMIDQHFGHASLAEILTSLRAVAVSNATEKTFADAALAAIARNSPLSMACAARMIADLRDAKADIETALQLEYRFTARAMEHGDFLEGIRAAIIDKDRAPRWKHTLDGVGENDISAMLAPLEMEFTP